MSFYNVGKSEDRCRFFYDNSSGSLETVISTQNQWTSFTGSLWEINGYVKSFVKEGERKIKYTSGTSNIFMMFVDVEIESTGNNIDYEVQIFKNDVNLSESSIYYSYKTTPIHQGHVFIQRLEENDELEIKIRNTTDTTNVTIHHSEIVVWSIT